MMFVHIYFYCSHCWRFCVLLSHTRWLKYMVCSHDCQSLLLSQEWYCSRPTHLPWQLLCSAQQPAEHRQWSLARCVAPLAGICPPHTGADLAERDADQRVWRDVILCLKRSMWPGEPSPVETSGKVSLWGCVTGLCLGVRFSLPHPSTWTVRDLWFSCPGLTYVTAAWQSEKSFLPLWIRAL